MEAHDDTDLLARLQAELALRSELEARQRALAELARDLAAVTRDPRAMMDLVAQRLGELLDGCCSVRVVEDGKLEPPRSLSGTDPALAHAFATVLARGSTLGIGLFERVAAHGTALRVDVLPIPGAAEQLGPECADALEQLRGRSLLIVPLLVGGVVLGVVGVCSRRRGPPYTDADQELLDDAAQHAALAIANARQLAATQHELATRIRAQARLRQLSELSREFAAATDGTAKLLDLVAKRISQIFDDSCTVRLVAEDGETFERTGGVHYRDPEIVEQLRRAMRDTVQRRGEGFAGRILAEGRSSIMCATPQELGAQTVPSFMATLQKLGVTALMGAPLRSGGRIIGVVSLARMGRNAPYLPEDLAFLEDLLDHASLAVHNVRLIESTRHELAERRRAEAALQQTQEQFRHAQKMEAIGRLAGGVAHDFNNLLSVILSCSGLVLEELDRNDPRRGDLEQIESAGQRAADLTRQLLAFSRQQAQRRVVLDVNEIVREMETMIRRVIGEDIALETDVTPRPAIVRADRGQLHQIVMNLAVNARDAMPGGGRLRVSTARVDLDAAALAGHPQLSPGCYVVLALADNGMGMDAATQERIFEPFFTTKEQGKGTGLGLSTVFGIVEQSGGMMRVESAPGRGATFRVYLPCCEDVPQSIATPRVTANVRGDETILLVEDDAQVRKVALMILERSGYRVLVAEDGMRALEVFARERGAIDLLLTDVVMPEMSGRELAEQLLAERADLRVLFMSGYNEEALLRHGGPDSGVDLLEKPIVPATLLARVREALLRTPALASN